jgi:glycosyltransferase involved in cell wall biosynthesis
VSARRLGVVSYLANDPFTPRGIRTRALLAALERDWAIELQASSAFHAAPDRRSAVRRARKAVASVSKRLILDPQEPWSYRRFRSWDPQVDAALLIGNPVSPVVYAAARLRDAGIPYVVDMGDPWVLTAPRPVLRRPVIWRAARVERALWSGASGAVTQSKGQADALTALYPQLPTLVRPNGYQGGSIPIGDRASRTQSDDAGQTLKLLHFGTLSSVLLDVREVLARLADSGQWREVQFTHYGHAWPGALDEGTPKVTVTVHEPVPWDEAKVLAREHDVALVMGTRRPYLSRMPSKAVEYLTLPIPRLAISCGADEDPLAQYVSGKPGWLCCTIDEPRLPERVRSHVSRGWSAAELAPPAGEAWPRVANEIAAFVNSALSATSDAHTSTGRIGAAESGPRQQRAQA